jgi:hypothetical protein
MTNQPETVAADRTHLLTGVAVALLVVGVALFMVGRPYLAVIGSVANLAGVLILLDVWVRRRLLQR